MPEKKNLVGKKFGRWRVLYDSLKKDKNKKTL